MAKKKPIILKHKIGISYQSLLATDCGCSERTVYSALRWQNDTDIQNLVRARAYELGFVNLIKSPPKLQKLV